MRWLVSATFIFQVSAPETTVRVASGGVEQSTLLSVPRMNFVALKFVCAFGGGSGEVSLVFPGLAAAPEFPRCNRIIPEPAAPACVICRNCCACPSIADTRGG